MYNVFTDTLYKCLNIFNTQLFIYLFILKLTDHKLLSGSVYIYIFKIK